MSPVGTAGRLDLTPTASLSSSPARTLGAFKTQLAETRAQSRILQLSKEASGSSNKRSRDGDSPSLPPAKRLSKTLGVRGGGDGRGRGRGGK